MEEKISIIKKIWRKTIPDEIKAYIGSSLNMKYNSPIISCGELNPDKVFYVIRFEGKAMGLYSLIFCILPFYKYCRKKKYIPIVDYRNYFAPLIQDEEYKNIDNAWEYYYQQSSPYTLDEVYKSKNVILGLEHHLVAGTPNWKRLTPCSNKTLKQWNGIIQQYLILQPHLQKKVNEIYNELFLDKKRVLGVGIRAGYRAGMMRDVKLYEGHPKVPDCDEFINYIYKYLSKWNYEYFFLSVDDREYEEKISRRFSDQCIVYNRRRFHLFNKDEPVTSIKEVRQEYVNTSIRELTEEYVVETYLLSKCDSIYASINGGTEFAYFLNGGKFTHCDFYNEGTYQDLGKNEILLT